MNEYKNSKFILNNYLKDACELPSYFNQNAIIIYEVVRLIDKKILFLEDHIQRFFDSFKLLTMKPDITEKEISDQLYMLIHSNKFTNANLKFQVQIDKQTFAQDFISFFIPHAYPTKNQYDNGVKVSMLKASRTNPNAKVQNVSLREMSDQIIHNENVYEVILINNDGFVTEGSRSNLFMIKNDEVKTSQLADILPGITRKYIIQICRELKINCIESQISQDEMLSMDAMFITGTSPKVLPINSIYDNHFDVNNYYLRTIMKKFDERIHNFLQTQTILL